MATNISNDYVNFVKKSITNYTKIIMEKNFNKEIFDTLLNTYINTRYYNYYDSKRLPDNWKSFLAKQMQIKMKSTF